MKALFFFILIGMTPGLMSAQVGLPENWLGSWQGELVIYDAQGERQRLPMELYIQPQDSSFTWHIIYGADKTAGLRAYLLRSVDTAKGHFVIDEQNGILLDAFLLGGQLISRFEVMGSLLQSRVEVVGDTLYYEIIYGGWDAIRQSGDTVMDGDSIPPVQSFLIQGRQYAVLK
nr:hypothetical protein [Saprospiraceae bacterium]